MNYQTEFDKFAKSHGVSSTTLNKYKHYSQLDTPIMGMTPTIIEESPSNIAVMDVFSRLMKDRIIFLGTGIDDYVSNVITAQMLFLSTVDSKKDIKLYINSGGGSVYDGNSILDVMDLVTPDVATYCTGLSASMAAVILSHGAKGKRFCLKRSRVMIHQPLGGARGQASDIEINYKEIQKIKVELSQTLADNTGHTLDKVLADCDRDYWMNSTEALEYGIIDSIVSR
jgi:ATP-dependent Clp protease, protease subunit